MMTTEILKQAGRTSSSFGNYNLDTAVDLSLANLHLDASFGVYEVAIRNMRRVAKLLQPDVAVFLNASLAHVVDQEKRGFHGDDAIRGVIERKGRLFEGVRPGGAAVINRDDPNYRAIEQMARANGVERIVTFGCSDQADVQVVDAACREEFTDLELAIAGETHTCRLTLPGRHFVEDAAASIAVAHALECDISDGLAALGELEPASHRGQVRTLPIEGGQVCIVDEASSATIVSMQAALKSFLLTTPKEARRICILGDIAGLGTIAKREHQKLADFVSKLNVEYVLTIGPEMAHFHDAFPDRTRLGPHTYHVDDVVASYLRIAQPNDHVLIKSSRRSYLNQFCVRMKEAMQQRTRLAVRLPAVIENQTPPTPNRTIVIAGDTYFGESYQSRRESRGLENVLKERGYDESLVRIGDLLRESDLSVVNLECALTNRSGSPLQGKKEYILGGHPDQTAAVLKRHKVTAVMLGNNHAMDFGPEGVEETIESLLSHGIESFGAGLGKAAAEREFRCEFHESDQVFKLAVISGYAYVPSYDKRFAFYSGQGRIGVNNLHLGRLQDQVQRLHREGYFVIVSPHWGQNYSCRTWNQNQFAIKLIRDCRADLVLGHGAHVMTEIQKRRERWIFYSLGNFGGIGRGCRRGGACGRLRLS